MDEVYAALWTIEITRTFSPSDIGDQDNRDTDSNKNLIVVLTSLSKSKKKKKVAFSYTLIVAVCRGCVGLDRPLHCM